MQTENKKNYKYPIYKVRIKMRSLLTLFLIVLAMGFLLISCSDDGESESRLKDQSGDPTGNEGTVGTAGNAEGGMANPAVSAGSGLMAGLGPSSSPRHWILSVPFQRIEAGGFIMGSPKSENNRVSDENQVQVQITKPFEIMTTEVTQLMWVKVMGYNPSSFNESKEDALHSLGCDDYEHGMCPNHPVEHVSWNKVQEFIRKLNDSLSLTSCDGTPSSAKGCYRLPTEAEWEYSAKAGTTTAYSFGDNLDNLGDYA